MDMETGYCKMCDEHAATIESLRQQLSECEKECLEEARLNGMGSEREAKLMARLEECERERDELVAAAKKFCDDWKFCRGSEWPVRAFQELNAALAKLGADKKGEV